ncbi:VWA domain-containing protein [Haloarculaceae archaeon H-GB2-1]|nr:VWA domain-containing protein [Haloarculaceae archaeon H-GB2-1]
MDGEGSSCADRGMSTIVAISLLVAITIFSAILVVSIGGTAIDTIQEQTADKASSDSLQEARSRLAALSEGSANESATSFSLPENVDAEVGVDGEDRITIEARTTSSSYSGWDASDSAVCKYEHNLGTILYEQNDEILAYQAGGIWKQNTNGGTTKMVSSPELRRNGDTIELQLVNVSANESLADDSQIIARKNAVESETVQNNLTDHLEDCWTHSNGGYVPADLKITIESQYADAWYRYAKEELEPEEITYESSSDTVEMTFLARGSDSTAGGPGGSTTTTASPPSDDDDDGDDASDDGNADDDTDAGDGSGDETSDGSENETNTEETVNSDDDHVDVGSGILADGSRLTLSNNVEVSIEGSNGNAGPAWDDGVINATGDVELGNNADVYGDIYANGSITETHPQATAHGETHENAAVETPSAVASLIDRKARASEDDNDNDQAEDISDRQFRNCGQTCELSAGTYYFSTLTNPSDVVFDTSEGDVNIVVTGAVKFDQNNDVRVEGSNDVEIYAQDDFYVQNNVAVTTPDNTASQFWVYLKPDAQAALSNNKLFTGVLYGPGNETSGAEIDVSQHRSVIGALVGDVQQVQNNVDIIYDPALRNAGDDATASSGTQQSNDDQSEPTTVSTNQAGSSPSTTSSQSDAPDADHDGIADSEDNCVSTPNHRQSDADGDGTGDACDDDDTDGDGVPDHSDNCPAISNEANASDDVEQGYSCQDKDEDGVPNAYDDCPTQAGAGENGCAPIGERGGEVVINGSQANVTLLASQVGVQNDTTVVVPAETRQPMDVMFVLDTSNSMAWNDRNARRVTAAKGFMQEMNASQGDRAGAVEFNSSMRPPSESGSSTVTTCRCTPTRSGCRTGRRPGFQRGPAGTTHERWANGCITPPTGGGLSAP